MRYLGVAVVAAALGVAATPAAAQERFTDVIGGAGGDQFRLHCPGTSRLIGVTGRVGAYVDAIGPICEGNGKPGQSGRTPSRPKEAWCPTGSIVGQIGVKTLRSDNHLLDAMLIQCVAPGNRKFVTASVTYYTPTDSHDSTAGDFAKLALGGPITLLFGRQGSPIFGTLSCGADDIVGLQGRSGASIDAIGLICRRH